MRCKILIASECLVCITIICNYAFCMYICTISVLVCQPKVFEGIMVDQLMQFINDKLCDLLSAYRQDYSTQHVLLHAIEEWKVAFDKGQHIGVLLMDLSKAFEVIPHSLRLTKLCTYGISSDACKKFNRIQIVKLDDSRSSWKCAVHGVPQGSHAGPHIFNIFLNDLFYFLEDLCQTTNYTDDNCLAAIDYDINVIKIHLELASEVAIQWFKDDFMKANASNFQVLCISRNINTHILELCMGDHMFSLLW